MNPDNRERNRKRLDEVLNLIKNDRTVAEETGAAIKGMKVHEDLGACLFIAPRFDMPAEVSVTGRSSVEAVFAARGSHVAVLDFASACNPGGGVRYGASSQEESLCRSSVLLPCLEDGKGWSGFYRRHRDMDGERRTWYSDSAIVVPDVLFFEEDAVAGSAGRTHADVIVVAAPNLRPQGGYDALTAEGRKDYRKTLRNRIETVFHAALKTGADTLVLGAFGCGAFRNPPHIVAQTFLQVQERYARCFRRVEYAIRTSGCDDGNLEAFRSMFGRR